MTIKQDLLKAAAKSKKILGDSSEFAVDHLQKQANKDGGFKGRTAESDLYYTVFGLQGLAALGGNIDTSALVRYLDSFDNPQSLDFVSLACLIRCKSFIPDTVFNYDYVSALEKFRSCDGGFNNEPGAQKGTSYGCFLALGAYQDMRIEMPDPAGLIESLDSLKTADSAYANDSTIHAGSVPGTAAAVCVLHYIDQKIDEDTLRWLVNHLASDGGFTAADVVPFSDLLSTATALHALNLTGYSVENFREKCLDFVDTLWDGKGGFCGSSVDKTCDCEYTFYGLLALGNLA